MAPLLKELKAMTDEEVEKGYDKEAVNTATGTAYWRQELILRAQDRQTVAMIRLTRWIMILTVVLTIMAFAPIFLHFLPR